MLNSTLLPNYHALLNQHQETKYVYHIRQKFMEGEMLYPLNTLKLLNPAAYEAAVQKYKGREHVLEIKVKADDALWNDHLFFSPIDIADMLKIWIGLGYDTKRFEGLTYYKIPVSELEGKTTLCFEYTFCDRPNEGGIMNAETKIIDIKEYKFPTTIRPSTMEYWKNAIKEGKQPLLFCGVPHILVRGEVNVKGCEIAPLIPDTNNAERKLGMK